MLLVNNGNGLRIFHNVFSMTKKYMTEIPKISEKPFQRAIWIKAYMWCVEFSLQKIGKFYYSNMLLTPSFLEFKCIKPSKKITKLMFDNRTHFHSLIFDQDF